MDKATKQRLLGGLVLIIGAAIFLPIVLDGSGAKLTVPPMPTPPVVEGVEAISPKLDEAVQQAEQAVAEAQLPASAVEEDVQPDASAALVEEAVPVVPEKLADKPDTKAAELAAQQAKDQVKEKERLAREKAEAEAKKLAADKAAKEKLAAEKAAQEKLAKEKAAKEAAAKTAAAKAEQDKAKQLANKKAESQPAADLPSAWVVQVARLSSKAKADELVAKLRKKSFQARVQEDKGSWRVQVGPELRKEVAESVKNRLAADAELGVSGAFLQPYKP